MLSKILSLGDRVEITKSVNEEKKQELIKEKSIFAKPLISQVYDILDETQLRIAMPIVEGRVIPLPLNSRFDVCFFTSGGLYKSRFVVTERYKEGGLFILVIELIYELKKYQRRQYYRLECTMDIEYLSIDNDMADSLREDEELIKEVIDNNKLSTGIIVDISGGGVRFVSKEKLIENSVVLLKLDITLANNKSVYGVLGRVLSSYKVPNNELRYEQRIEYTDIQNSSKETIIRYIFEQERRMRQKN